MSVRVRFAPSPTGWLHVGVARTALYNFLFARKREGKFILRIEDTDRSRSTEEAIESIINDLDWLGLKWDEGPKAGGNHGPYRQTERENIYKKYINTLIENGDAYYCYCTPEDLEKQREAARKAKASYRYNRKCRNLTEKQRKEREKVNPNPAVRFKTPLEGKIIVRDLIRGSVPFDISQLDDFIIARSDGSATYNFAVTVDDALMEISHVIRGEDHLSNTPKQILVYQALNFDLPEFAHLSMILGPDKKPLSKRHGATAVFEFRKNGYLPEALVNYLALLGWSYDDKTNFFTKEDLLEKFSLDKVSANPAIFDTDKLDWLNGYWIRHLNNREISNRLTPLIKEVYGVESVNEGDFLELIEITKERMKHLTEFPEWSYFYFVSEEEFEIDRKDAKKAFKEKEKVKKVLNFAVERFARLETWEKENIEKILRSIPEKLNVKGKFVFQPIRAAVTGKLVSPPLFESIELLGKEKTVKRLEKALKYLE